MPCMSSSTAADSAYSPTTGIALSRLSMTNAKSSARAMPPAMLRVISARANATVA